LISDIKTGAVIGSSRYSGWDPAKDRVEIGYTFLARRYWGKGYNAELKQLMVDHAFQFVNQIHVFIGENNLRSRRAIEKIGAKLVEKIERQPQEGARYFSAVYLLKK